MKQFSVNEAERTKYIFFTGKGGVGKTSIACATAISLADQGKNILLISTDTASNLQDVFGQELNGYGKKIKEVPGLTVVNLDPEEAAAEYRESVIAPFRGKLPESVIKNMEEQLSGSCTVEIAAFNEFSDFITSVEKAAEYDHIIFDTAPTGHTLRMLQLPSAWSTFISESTHGASCLGQLSGLEKRKEVYKKAVNTLSDSNLTRLVLVSRPEVSPLKEAARSSRELKLLGVNNQILVINALLEKNDKFDKVTSEMYERQRNALKDIPETLKELPTFFVPLRSYNISDIANIREMLVSDVVISNEEYQIPKDFFTLKQLVDDLSQTGKRVIFTMGKGGVGKTTIATEIAKQLRSKGNKVHLTTTDPANHLDYSAMKDQGITMSKIDEEEVLENYKNEVRVKARTTMSEEDMEYIEEDLRSPCTQEIAVFRAFAEIVDKADDEIVVIDTAPTGHTLLLLDATQSYHREVERTHGDIPESVKKLLPRLRDKKETEVVIVTLPEATPVYEAERLQKDLKRAGINNKWWIINQTLSLTDTNNSFLRARAKGEKPWIDKVRSLSDNNLSLVPWEIADIKK
ncbi:MAG: arsenical pump-driving ATPase [Muribaculaceae bacterium]|nr:arsenical pump-driving ATPase [Muribaculaceae bacterium]